MGRPWLIGIFACAILVIAASSHGDVATNPTTTSVAPTQPTGTGVEATPEPITGNAATPAPGWATTPKDPFAPYDIGPSKWNTSPKPFWLFSDLPATQQALAMKAADTTAWQPIHAAYAAAAAEQAQRAAEASAVSQLGMDNLAGLGVVP